MSDGARDLLGIAQEVARGRGAQECSTRDLAIAAVVYRHMVADRDPDYEDGPQETTSPGMLVMGVSLHRCMASENSGTLHISELLGLAASENPDLSDYLG
ncbi:hypothetical protein E2651_24285 [Streptomyces sp. MZ04]|nr:hypothetical protein E2651_24285 [Streptomyces sp. MZ04]